MYRSCLKTCKTETTNDGKLGLILNNETKNCLVMGNRVVTVDVYIWLIYAFTVCLLQNHLQMN